MQGIRCVPGSAVVFGMHALGNLAWHHTLWHWLGGYVIVFHAGYLRIQQAKGTSDIIEECDSLCQAAHASQEYQSNSLRYCSCIYYC